MPPAVNFIFDRAGRDKTQREDLERESDGLVTFTSRRMYENYLLNPRAIAYVVLRIERFRDGDASVNVIVVLCSFACSVLQGLAPSVRAN